MSRSNGDTMPFYVTLINASFDTLKTRDNLPKLDILLDN